MGCVKCVDDCIDGLKIGVGWYVCEVDYDIFYVVV